MSSTDSNRTSELPWIYDITLEDSNWIITSSFMIFTMQTGFGMLESGCVSIKNEVNIMMKNVVDIVLGGLTYWMFGYAFSFGRSENNNGFMSFGDYLIDPDIQDPMKGAIYAAFIFQLSFATTATTIVSGAMAERCNFKAYCLFSFWNTLIYCIPAGWVWGPHGFLKKMGAVDIAGSGPVHLIGGSAALGAAIMLGPRLGRYDNGIAPLPLGSPVNAVMGLFVLWWGWLAFNSGSTYGLSGEKWQYAARAAVMTMMASFGGGTISILYSMIVEDGRIGVLAIINGVLGALVSITAGCFLYQAWEALIIGSIGALLSCIAMPLFDKMGIDDPVGASSVHGIGGIWGVLAVGIFADDPIPLDTTNGLKGLVHGGGWYLLGVQALACLCLSTWGVISCMVGVSRAISALRPVLDTSEVENVISIGLNPGHDLNLQTVKDMNSKRRYKLSIVLRNITKNRNFGINPARKLFPRGKEMKKKSAESTKRMSAIRTKQITPISKTVDTFKVGENMQLPMAWLD